MYIYLYMFFINIASMTQAPSRDKLRTRKESANGVSALGTVPQPHLPAAVLRDLAWQRLSAPGSSGSISSLFPLHIGGGTCRTRRSALPEGPATSFPPPGWVLVRGPAGPRAARPGTGVDKEVSPHLILCPSL